MEDKFTAVRWRKYGKDRLYISAGDGERVGWFDLLTGQANLEQGHRADEFAAAVEAWRASNPEARASATVKELATSPTTTESTNVPRREPRHHVQRPPQVEVAATEAAAVPTHQDDPRAASSLAEKGQTSWTDLTVHVPGQLARQQAEVELAAQRGRSRVGSFLARTFDAKTDERAWRVGASGEETVGARLEKLTKHGWHVLHAVPVGERGSDIDHVAIGHGGVYTLNTKTHPGGSVWVGKHQVRVNGHKTDYLRNSRHESARAERLLTAALGFPVMVRPALVFLTGSLIPNVTIKQQPDDVLVYDRMDIPRVFKRAPKRLTPEQVAVVFEQARRSTTWQAAKVAKS